MTLSKRSIELLIDLVEIKLSCIEIYDRMDRREIERLKRCREELASVAASYVGPGRIARRVPSEARLAH
jgi:hypothetical protein